jgi:Ca-activated chloride channel family protein
MFKDLEFAHPAFFWMLLIVPAMIAWYSWRQQQLQGSLSVSAAKSFRLPVKTTRAAYRHSGLVLRSLAVIALIVAMARPNHRGHRHYDSFRYFRQYAGRRLSA